VILCLCEFADDLVEFVLELSDDCRAFLVLLLDLLEACGGGRVLGDGHIESTPRRA
jgi:hypothetical protein